MSARNLTIVDDTGRQATVMRSGVGWSIFCTDVPDDYQCKARVVGYDTRSQGIRGAEAHLRWHANGKPECRECGAWLNRKGSTRCRKGTCEVDR